MKGHWEETHSIVFNCPAGTGIWDVIAYTTHTGLPAVPVGDPLPVVCDLVSAVLGVSTQALRERFVKVC